MSENTVSSVRAASVCDTLCERRERLQAMSKGYYSAAPVENANKWSHEAIIARSNMRPERMQKLKLAANLGQNLGFDFLQQCCHDDPALQIVIKKLLAKFPQWGVAVVDGVLMKWNE